MGNTEFIYTYICNLLDGYDEVDICFILFQVLFTFDWTPNSEVLDKIDCIIFINLILSDKLQHGNVQTTLIYALFGKFPWWSTGFSLPGNMCSMPGQKLRFPHATRHSQKKEGRELFSFISNWMLNFAVKIKY